MEIDTLSEPNWIDEDLIENLHDRIIEEFGGKSGIRDQLLIGSALTRPQNSYYYQGNDDIFDLAAIYSQGIAKNHAFIDGNKRTAFAAADIFLSLNGYQLNAQYEMIYVEAMEKIASDKIERSALREIFNRCADKVAPEINPSGDDPAISSPTLPVIKGHFDFARMARNKEFEPANMPIEVPIEVPFSQEFN